QRIAQAQLVICRSGASSVSELSVLGRPAILVPLPGALDQDQAANAKVLEKVGGGWPIPQADLFPARMTSELERFMNAPDLLIEAARQARSVARPDAVKRLADLVEKVSNSEGDRP
ncbi:MAG: glycosyltransferase, partial [Nitratireductor sp.]